jgi:hypothetical protein
MKSPALKAGLVGAGVMIVIGLVSLIPVLGCISLPLEWLAYIAIGALAGYWLAPVRQAGQGAGQGALAGLIAGFVSGIVRTLLAPASLALSGGPQAIISQLPPESLQAFRSAGVDPSTFFGPGMLAGFTAVCCLPAGLLLGAALGALGGLIYASASPGTASTPPPPAASGDSLQP